MAESKVPAAILHHPDPDVRQLALARWEACERCEDFVRVCLAVLEKPPTEKSQADAHGREMLRSLRALIQSALSDCLLAGQDTSDLLDYVSGLDVVQAAVDVTPAGGDFRNFIARGAIEAATPKMAKYVELALKAATPKVAEGAKPVTPAPALDLTAGRKLLAEVAAFAYATKKELLTVCSRRLVAGGTPPEGQRPSSAGPGNLADVEGVRRRPAYARDHLWLDWHERDELGPAGIRDRWNDMSDEERKTASPRASWRIGGKDAKGKKAGLAVVTSALKKARKEMNRGL